MFETLSILPPGFWAVIALLIAGAVLAKGRLGDGSGLPTFVVLGTVAAWYVGDAFYNNYAENHVKLFDADTLESAWWQVAWFVAVFLAVTPWLHGWINASHLNRGSGVLRIFKQGINQPVFQRQLNLLFRGSFSIWLVIVAIAALRLKGEILYYFFPFLGYKAEPWGRDRIGSGFDALLSFAMYVQLLVTAIFGVVTALATNRRIRSLAFVCCLLSWPYFIFDRTRNTLLAAVIPGIVSWGLLRIRGGILKKAAVLGACFLLLNAWMAFIITNRSNMSVAAALKEKGFSLGEQEKVHHEGLNMYEELCWINTLVERGSYTPNWGARYFAELVNCIPRTLWPGKPLIGIDYAIARGQGGGEAGSAGVNSTVSTGLIGQGVTNFGRILGPAAAAVLMGLWVAVLARLDLHIEELGRLPLYASGLILTFNLGRDITLITLYPFVFGMIGLWAADRYWPRIRRGGKPVRRNSPAQPGAIAGALHGGLAGAARARTTPRRKARFPFLQSGIQAKQTVSRPFAVRPGARTQFGAVAGSRKWKSR
jgi:hypothetical protein